MKQQTAVEWFYDQITRTSWDYNTVEQAKAMEKERMKACYEHAMLALLETGHGESFEEYYTKTYNK